MPILNDKNHTLLKAENIKTGYDKKLVVNDVSLTVATGEIVALIGHNGAGKSTLLKAIFGLLPLWNGRVSVNGSVFYSPNPRELLKLNVVYVPQGNRVFNDLTVYENLIIGSAAGLKRKLLNDRIELAFELFPLLKNRLHHPAASLSGGEKQMLCFANALILSPRLLLLDEPSLGLAPPLVSQTFLRIQKICQNADISCLMVEQKVREVLKIANRVYVLRQGRVSFEGNAGDISNDNKLREVYL